MLRRGGAPRPALPAGPYLVVGLRRAGVAVAKALAARAPGTVVGWDASESDAVVESVAELERHGVSATLAGDPVALLDRTPTPACVVKSPGVPLDAPPLVDATRRGIAVVDEAEIGWRLDARPFVGTTGTNGKSTVCALVAAVVESAGARAVVAGNTAFGPPLSQLDESDADVVVAELSSFQLAAAPALLPDAAVFTNLSDDHWEHHGGRDAYAAAKRRLFVRGDRCVPLAVVNIDDAMGAALVDDVSARGGAVVTYGTAAGVRVEVRAVESGVERSTMTLAVDGRELAVRTRMPGSHNALNVAAAIAFAVGAEIPVDGAIAAIAECALVPGRFERVDRGQPFAAIVDYAHNPAGVRALLAAVRETGVTGRLIAVSSALSVFDERQHREHGAALAGADELIVSLERFTPDEPYDEPPPGLLEGVASAGATAVVIPDRRVAVRHAVGRAAPGDAVLVLNRGARRSPILDADDRIYRPDDRELLAEAIEERWP